MTRPLIITDCDEVLLHMLVPFRAWADEAHDLHFDFDRLKFADALRHKDSDEPVTQDIVWTLLTAFFDSEMHRQKPISGSMEALARLSAIADIVVLTNIDARHRQGRVEQLAGHGLDAPVHCNRGGKGRPLAQIVADRQPSVALFIDDIAEHHASAARHAPGVWRLHMVGEPELSGRIPPAGMAHARIDNWAQAEAWIAARLAEGPAPRDIPLPDGAK
ncbi:FMN phosphatase YigB (HAD superfamily) [Sphingobium wenxiniae]|jgi:FMN phosphatase YigB (HAD superfamily)|uniref:HAD family hydrolase n=2 Tax=Sphingobium TaxID=165695 RepID=T0GEY2_9SPHN|nr:MULTISPECIES: hypothetical protein [Sphingobium]EQA99221.1 hypothetical protein L485_16875 [Sphingobium baderi LL03]KMS61350.1 hypothetical protein V475_13570 [Sphingobium baderi LL03]MBB6191030.1 FMN phosphatase YigB (HAD superfamily) [Sphingobium wenxiniae]TWH93664.1 FMN phosphatase YigB (HAD superfamily) [Sphingobium wenxiniae]WRD75566.1 HAD family hydrolase [Sphingobium baderi]